VRGDDSPQADAQVRRQAMNLDELKFSKDHEWIKVEGKRAMIGITDYAQNELGDIVYIELPEMGQEVSAMEEITEIESTKTTAPVLAPVSGRIIEINEELKDSPELVNEDPYGKGWIGVIDMSDPSEVEELMDHKEYEEYLEQEGS
jgi:glycine cleavage system H protein